MVLMCDRLNTAPTAKCDALLQNGQIIVCFCTICESLAMCRMQQLAMCLLRVTCVVVHMPVVTAAWDRYTFPLGTSWFSAQSNATGRTFQTAFFCNCMEKLSCVRHVLTWPVKLVHFQMR